MNLKNQTYALLNNIMITRPSSATQGSKSQFFSVVVHWNMMAFEKFLKGKNERILTPPTKQYAIMYPQNLRQFSNLALLQQVQIFRNRKIKLFQNLIKNIWYIFIWFKDSYPLYLFIYKRDMRQDWIRFEAWLSYLFALFSSKLAFSDWFWIFKTKC